MNHPVWRPEDGALLQQLRVNARWDDLVFARANTISLAQLRELEGQGQGTFYTPQIKAHTGYKLLRKLGHEPVVSPSASTLETDNTIGQDHASAQSIPVATVLGSEDPSPNSALGPMHVQLASLDKVPTFSAMALPLAVDVTFTNDNHHKPQATDPQHPSPSTNTTANDRTDPRRTLAVLLLLAVAWAVYSTPWDSLQNMAKAATTDSSSATEDKLVSPAAQHQIDGTFGTSSVTASTAASFIHSPQSDQHDDPEFASTPPAPLEPAGDNTEPHLDCDWRHRTNSPLFQQGFPVKPGNYIYFVALQDARLCVIDQQNQLTTLQLKAGMAKSVYGEPPFLVHSPDWSHLHLFYQGHRVSGTPQGEAHWVFKSKPLVTQNNSASTAMAQTQP